MTEGEDGPRAPHRLLILDDDALLRRVWERAAVTRPDVLLTIVATAPHARAALQGDPNRFDLVVCDFRLGPGETSLELVRELHAAGAPVIVVSGDVRDARAAVSGLGVRVVAKPIGIDGLLAIASGTA